MINQRKHHGNQLGPVGPLTAKAVSPFKIKKQITQNTFEINIHLAIEKKKRPVFHSSEMIPFDTGDLDQDGFLPLENEQTILIYWTRRRPSCNKHFECLETARL